MTENNFGSSSTQTYHSQDNVAPSLEPLYTRLQSVSFTDSASAIRHCRALCAEFGFTVKQEASSQKNIYIYCSREGLPESKRNPKSHPIRKRPSKRCDCRWRVVLFERNGVWRFRKSLNPDATRHNHPLMRPEDIDTSWPREVTDAIYALAKQHLETSEIRTRVKAQYTHVVWNERRFYNRLAEARQKIKQEETVKRARHLTSVWARVCMVAAGSEQVSRQVEEAIQQLLEDVCRPTRLDPNTLQAPVLNQEDIGESYGSEAEDVRYSTPTRDGSPSVSPETTTDTEIIGNTASRQPTSSRSSKSTIPPKGYMTVEIPSHSYFVKVHGQRKGSDLQAMQPDRHRSLSVLVQESSGLPGLAQRSSGQSSSQRQGALPGQGYAQHATPLIYTSGYTPTGVPCHSFVHSFQHSYSTSSATPELDPIPGEIRMPYVASNPPSLLQHPDTAVNHEQSNPMTTPTQHGSQPHHNVYQSSRQRAMSMSMSTSTSTSTPIPTPTPTSMFRLYPQPDVQEEQEQVQQDWSG